MAVENQHLETDLELVDRYLSDPGGEAGRSAASKLLGRYEAKVYQWCFGYVREREAALDLAQEVLINAYRGLGQFDRRARFSSWLFAVSRNRCLTAVRSKRPDLQPVDEVSELPEPRRNVEAELARIQKEEALRMILRGHLDPGEEEALWLRAVERMPVEQITTVLGLENASGARGLLQSARRKLRRAFPGDFGEI